MTLINNRTYDDFLKWVELQPRLAFDLETSGLAWYHDARMCGVALGREPHYFYVPFRHRIGENIPLERLPELVRLLEQRTLIGWNIKFDLEMIIMDGYRFTPQTSPLSQIEDVSIAAHSVNENEPSFALKRVADRYLGPQSSLDESELQTWIEREFADQLRAIRSMGKLGDVWKGAIHMASPDMVEPYAAADAMLTWRLREYYQPYLVGMGMIDEDGYGFFNDRNLYLQEIIDMELAGVQIDLEQARQLEDDAHIRMDELAVEIQLESDGAITNPMSPAQVNKYFGRKSTRKEDLEHDETLKAHPIGAKLREYRSANKLVTSFLNSYSRFSGPEGDIHPSFNIIGTETSRLSCSSPNLMAVPRASGEQNMWVARVKSTIIPREGYVLGEFDLSQAELRIASHYGAIAIANSRGEVRNFPIMSAMTYDNTGQPVIYEDRHPAVWWREHYPDLLLLSPMGQILVSGLDLHQQTADLIGTDRDTAKRINFSAVFGIGPPKYSQTYFVPLHEAKRNLSSWHRQFPEFRALLNQKDEEATTHRYIQLESGYIRRYPPGANTYQASSNWVQGTVAEIMRTAICYLGPKLRAMGARILLQIHDSIMVEVPEGKEQEVWQLIKETFSSYRFSPPLGVGNKFGPRWSELKGLDE